MRMRKKRHREERMARCADVWIQSPAGRGDWAAAFGRAAPLHIEIGCGKGRFITETALRHPERNFVAVEKCPDVLLLAMEKTKLLEIPNIRFLMADASGLTELFAPGEAERIYLNFSDPWPKVSTAKRRLTAPAFLAQYRQVLCPGGSIHMKTDNRNLFAYSLNTFAESGFALKNVTYDLHKEGSWDGVVTEYEATFMEQNLPIYRLEAYKASENGTVD